MCAASDPQVACGLSIQQQEPQEPQEHQWQVTKQLHDFIELGSKPNENN